MIGDQPSYILELEGAVKKLGGPSSGVLAFDIADGSSVPLMQAVPKAEPFIAHEPNSSRFRVSIELPPLVPGVYLVSAWAGSHYTETLDAIEAAITFTVPTSPTSGRSFPHSANHGFIVPKSTVSFERESEASACAG